MRNGSEKAASTRKERREEEFRFHAMAGTRQALAELMAWSGIEEQSEAITLMVHHLRGLGPGGALPMLRLQRHVIEISQNVSLAFHQNSQLMIQQGRGDEVITGC
ncbi:hypothetical protein [Pseudomonas sp. IAC-BECa141]|uniref:hypothetical protein n=1 Tax=Pseudomonas sp. IAC-BECa141 TaxID=2793103 RepID=UPI001D066F59|nr:hypothetical protein [Pseudomonas sp. IAC-BECa141]UDI95291.1 hypothetical protein I5961_12585 [Pseudomonas sp. IAC-BECa141]